ncbi:MAG: preprotein translocase subunit SecE [Verrucomicrobia bacterium]|nr:preprotein translocase subunit SecE [Verrucomicrobiota bacterium]NMD22042.1 preprotein translocase subunit SecE [Verrucomicrobiota bacterium]
MKLSTYFVETREELRKCTWPSRDELAGSTVVVLISTAILSLMIVLADFLILKLVRGVLPRL